MKSRVNYIELPIKVFAEKFPELMAMLPPVISPNDPNYIVRMKEHTFEVGYRSDEWEINNSAD